MAACFIFIDVVRPYCTVSQIKTETRKLFNANTSAPMEYSQTSSENANDVPEQIPTAAATIPPRRSLSNLDTVAASMPAAKAPSTAETAFAFHAVNRWSGPALSATPSHCRTSSGNAGMATWYNIVNSG
mmetsp:Transcript_12720/g.22674  ORF Transcript_12720/g.22674 Transcript_12720/m.22674 type:complete len:129 (+) Transcript_12720:1709-2095(+)